MLAQAARLAILLLASYALCAIKGDTRYTVEEDINNVWLVFSDGYENGHIPVDKIVVDKLMYAMNLLAAWNGEDTLPDRKHMSDVLEDLWVQQGLQLKELKSIKYTMVLHDPTQDAIENARKVIGLGEERSFTIDMADNEPATVAAWDFIRVTPFFKATERVAQAAGCIIERLSIDHFAFDDMIFLLEYVGGEK